MGANYSFEVENIEIWVPAFFKHNDLSVATVRAKEKQKILKLGSTYTLGEMNYIFFNGFIPRLS